MGVVACYFSGVHDVMQMRSVDVFDVWKMMLSVQNTERNLIKFRRVGGWLEIQTFIPSKYF
jgi:hypothetical protein